MTGSLHENKSQHINHASGLFETSKSSQGEMQAPTCQCENFLTDKGTSDVEMPKSLDCTGQGELQASAL